VFVEDVLKQIMEGQNKLFEGQKQLLARVEKIDDNLSEVNEKVDNIKEQQEGNTLLIDALMHRTEEIKDSIANPSGRDWLFLHYNNYNLDSTAV
jgi:vacuolar-type H+-ATPase subunit E/Vma4